MTSEAIVIGVNQYEFLQPLEYGRQDALALKMFLEMEAKFDRVYYFADDAPVVDGVSMRPTRNNLRRVMRDTFAKPFMGDGDNFWFFFSGHGMRDGERDFLMPIDGDPDDVAESGISTAQVSEWLRGCGADNVVMILDACRSGGRKDGKGIGDETKEDCRQTGVISLFSCSPNQFSYELPQYQQGAFTKALLEGLGTQGACATVARLDEYLKRRVPEVVRECLGNKVNQFPYSIAEPINKSHLILMPQHSRPEDLNALKMDALWAEKRGDLRLALQCWLRVNVASGGLDADFHDAVFDLRLKLRESTIQPPKPKSQTTPEVPLIKRDLGGSGIEAKPIPEDRSPVPDNKIVDYSKLQELLENRQWREADEETYNVMNKVSGNSNFGSSSKRYPQHSIKKIDQLWSDASDGKFGFIAQARIWQQVGRDKSKFDIQVGWKLTNATRQINQSKLKLKLEEAEVGHFPAFFKSWGGGGWSCTEYLLDRVSEIVKKIDLANIILVSEAGIDYSNLHDLLMYENWRQADQETMRIMNTLMKYCNMSVAEKLAIFPSEDLQIINRLWTVASDNHFGFSIQKEIWKQCDYPSNAHDPNWVNFGQRVGWHQDNEWVTPDHLKFSIAKSCKGELPFGSYIHGGWGFEEWRMLLSRIEL